MSDDNIVTIRLNRLVIHLMRIGYKKRLVGRVFVPNAEQISKYFLEDLERLVMSNNDD